MEKINNYSPDRIGNPRQPRNNLRPMSARQQSCNDFLSRINSADSKRWKGDNKYKGDADLYTAISFNQPYTGRCVNNTKMNRDPFNFTFEQIQNNANQQLMAETHRRSEIRNFYARKSEQLRLWEREEAIIAYQLPDY